MDSKKIPRRHVAIRFAIQGGGVTDQTTKTPLIARLQYLKQRYNVSEQINPIQLGAIPCKGCGSTDLDLSIRELDRYSRFVVISCKDCPREATSDVFRYTDKCVKDAIFKWNTYWAEISHFLDADSEGVKYL
jgi:hypothetical protein